MPVAAFEMAARASGDLAKAAVVVGEGIADRQGAGLGASRFGGGLARTLRHAGDSAWRHRSRFHRKPSPGLPLAWRPSPRLFRIGGLVPGARATSGFSPHGDISSPRRRSEERR